MPGRVCSGKLWQNGMVTGLETLRKPIYGVLART